MNVYFLLSCNKCKWWRKSNGTTEDLKDLREHKPCSNCNLYPRKFKCPKCGNIIKMFRVNERNDADIQKEIPRSDSGN